MRQAFNIGIVIILALLVGNRVLTRVQAHEHGAVSCAKGSELVRLEALARGFSTIGARSQGENFMSSCLVSGEAQSGSVVAHD
jgi:hypothetical protein